MPEGTLSGWGGGGDNLHNTIGIVYTDGTEQLVGMGGLELESIVTPDPMIALLGNRKYAFLHTVN